MKLTSSEKFDLVSRITELVNIGCPKPRGQRQYFSSLFGGLRPGDGESADEEIYRKPHGFN